MVLVIACPQCKSRLHAKESLIGQQRPCPKCKTLVLIAEPIPESELAPGVVPNATEPLPTGAPPTRLQHRYRYIICNADSVLAMWESGQGWSFQLGVGFATARRNPDAIPDQGTFLFTEFVIDENEGRLQPQALRFFGIVKRGALTAIARPDENEILNYLEPPVVPTLTQRNALIAFLRSQFMPDFWGSSGLLAALSSPTLSTVISAP